MPKLIGLVAHGVAVILGHHLAVVADGGEDDEIGAGAERANLGHFGRPETARKGELALAAHLLAAKQQHRIVLERSAHRGINGIVGRDVGQRNAAYFGGKAWTQRDDFHGSILHGFLICLTFLQKPPAGNHARPIGAVGRDRWIAPGQWRKLCPRSCPRYAGPTTKCLETPCSFRQDNFESSTSRATCFSRTASARKRSR